MVVGASNELVSGDNSVQCVAAGNQVVNVSTGLTKEFASQLAELNATAFRATLLEFASVAKDEADRRMMEFEKTFLNRLACVESGFEVFKDPAFQCLLAKAHVSSAQSDAADDYARLSEILAMRMTRQLDRKSSLGLKKAIEVVQDIDTNALNLLTLIHAFNRFMPSNQAGDSLKAGLNILDTLFEKLLYGCRLDDSGWIEHLSLIGAVRISNAMRFRDGVEYLREEMSGYVCAGLKKGSEAHQRCLHILNDAGIPEEILVDNELLDGYVRVLCINKNDMSDITITGAITTEQGQVKKPLPLSDSQVKSIYAVMDSYDRNHDALNIVNKKFNEEVSKCTHIMQIIDFRAKQKEAFVITPMGSVLANINAKLKHPLIPDLPL